MLEPKWDGYRMLASVDAGRTRCWTRHGTVLTEPVAAIASELGERLPSDSLVDGELVALDTDAEGRVGQDFGQLGAAVLGGRPRALSYVVFDVVRLAGTSLLGRPWHERRAALERALGGPQARVSLIHTFPAQADVHEALVQLGFEGSVLKRLGARYQPGRRSTAWQKLKTRTRCAATVAIVPRDRSSGVVERVGLRDADDPDRLTWAVVWASSVRGQLSADPMGPVGWPAEVTYTHRTIAGALREPRLTALGSPGPSA